MPFLTQGKTNWKFLLIVVVLATIVGGGILWCPKIQELTYQPPEIQRPAEVDETADWRTYRNETLAFEIKYPNGFKVSNERILSTGTEIDFYKTYQIEGQEIKDTIMYIRVGVRYSQELMREYTLDEWVDQSFFPLIEGESKKTITFGIDSYKGIKIEKYKSVGIIKLIPYVFIQRDKGIYEITGYVPSLTTNFPKDYNPYEIFDQMLSTFRFIEEVSERPPEIKFDSIPEELRKTLLLEIENRYGYSGITSVSFPREGAVESVDLNNDGEREFILDPIAAYTNNGSEEHFLASPTNFPIYIFQKRDEGWVKIFYEYGMGIRILGETTNGYHNIESENKMGAAQYVIGLYQWQETKSEYECTGIEDVVITE